MKKSITAVIAAAGILSFGAAAEVTPSDNTTPSKICAAAANDKVGKVKRLLKDEHKVLRLAASNIQCDGKPLTEFAMEMNATSVVKSLAPEKSDIIYVAKR